MVYYHLGAVIRELRDRLHMTQEELAAGICSVSSISKIEKGRQMPSVRVTEAMLGRLKDVGCFFTGFGTAEELLGLRDWETLVYQAAHHRDAGSIFEEQLYKYVLLVQRMQAGGDEISGEGGIEASVALLELMEILVISMPLTELYQETAMRRTYTWLELHLLNSISVQFYHMESYEAANRILERLLQYLEGQGIQGEQASRLYPVVCNNLAVVKVNAGLPYQAKSICQKGIEASLSAGLLTPLSGLYGNLSSIQSALHETIEAQKNYSYAQTLQQILADHPDVGKMPWLQLLEDNWLTCYTW